jgi:hypothetical protein
VRFAIAFLRLLAILAYFEQRFHPEIRRQFSIDSENSRPDEDNIPNADNLRGGIGELVCSTNANDG